MEVGTIFMGISKAFDIVNHLLFLAKVRAYGLQPTVLKQTESYLTSRHERTKVNNAYSL